MAAKQRWMTWVIEETSKQPKPAPWARNAQPTWKTHLAVKAPALKVTDFKSA